MLWNERGIREVQRWRRAPDILRVKREKKLETAAARARAEALCIRTLQSAASACAITKNSTKYYSMQNIYFVFNPSKHQAHGRMV